jgi:hypothetical protein
MEFTFTSPQSVVKAIKSFLVFYVTLSACAFMWGERVWWVILKETGVLEDNIKKDLQDMG